MGLGCQRHAPTALHLGRIWRPLYKRLNGPHSRSVRVRKISTPPALDPRTVQPVVSRYTDGLTYKRLSTYRLMNIEGEKFRIVMEITPYRITILVQWVFQLGAVMLGQIEVYKGKKKL